MARNRSAVKAAASTRGQDINVHVTVEGLDRTDAAFKRARREVSGRMRDVMVRVGERDALPAAKSAFPSRTFASTLYVQRDRSGIFLGSRARGPLNRTVGWLDFGGRRPRDTERRSGPYTLVHTLDSLRAKIDREVLEELAREFSRDFEVT